MLVAELIQSITYNNSCFSIKQEQYNSVTTFPTGLEFAQQSYLFYFLHSYNISDSQRWSKRYFTLVGTALGFEPYLFESQSNVQPLTLITAKNGVLLR